jgi:hypothetical protein
VYGIWIKRGLHQKGFYGALNIATTDTISIQFNSWFVLNNNLDITLFETDTVWHKFTSIGSAIRDILQTNDYTYVRTLSGNYLAHSPTHAYIRGKGDYAHFYGSL